MAEHAWDKAVRMRRRNEDVIFIGLGQLREAGRHDLRELHHAGVTELDRHVSASSIVSR